MAFDILLGHKDEIESQLGISLVWERADQYKASWICLSLKDVSVTNEEDWPRMAKFHAEWSDRLCHVVLPYLQDFYKTDSRLMDIAGMFREWAVNQDAVKVNLAKCNCTYTRFTTDGMSEILPDLADAPSGWNTDNHYFYEIINRTGNSTYIQLSISSQNITDDFRAVCDRINEFYPARMSKKDWQWRMHFKTKTIKFSVDTAKESIFVMLDECLNEILIFEGDLRSKLQRKPTAEGEMKMGTDMEKLKKKFEAEMVQIYTTAKEECGYNATRFLQMIGEKGGLAAAKTLIGRQGGTDGFARLWECHRLDLSVEAHVLKPEYEALFTEEERKLCRDRLEQFGYKIAKE